MGPTLKNKRVNLTCIFCNQERVILNSSLNLNCCQDTPEDSVSPEANCRIRSSSTSTLSTQDDNPVSNLVNQFLTVLERFGQVRMSQSSAQRDLVVINKLLIISCLQLCAQCSENLRSACSLYHDIKCLEINLQWKLRELRDTMMASGQDGKLGLSSDPGISGAEMETLSYISEFRQRVVDKLSRIVINSPPRVMVEEERNEKGSDKKINTEDSLNVGKMPKTIKKAMKVVKTEDQTGYSNVESRRTRCRANADDLQEKMRCNMEGSNDMDYITIDDDGSVPTPLEILSTSEVTRNCTSAAANELSLDQLIKGKESPAFIKRSDDGLKRPTTDRVSRKDRVSNASWRKYKSGLMLKVGNHIFIDSLSRRMLKKRLFLAKNNDRMPAWSEKCLPLPCSPQSIEQLPDCVTSEPTEQLVDNHAVTKKLYHDRRGHKSHNFRRRCETRGKKGTEKLSMQHLYRLRRRTKVRRLQRNVQGEWKVQAIREK